MHNATQELHDFLERKDALLATLVEDDAVSTRLRALQRWQARRLAATYEDLRLDPHLREAVEFFLSDLYGPHDFASRDRALRRTWRSMEAALPAAAIHALSEALELEVLTLELDVAVARKLPAATFDVEQYASAYRVVGRATDRDRQIARVVGLARRLGEVVARPWIGRMLRVARAPAHAAGFGVLQDFLERGVRAFAAINDSSQLADLIDQRERALMHRLLRGDPDPFAALTAHFDVSQDAGDALAS